MKPTENKVWIKVRATREKSAGGLYLPELGNIGGVGDGYVAAVGPGRLTPTGREPCNCKPGDLVLFNTSTGACLTISLKDKKTNIRQNYYVMPDVEIIAVLDDEAEGVVEYGDESTALKMDTTFGV